jgi:hypothetical protein
MIGMGRRRTSGPSLALGLWALIAALAASAAAVTGCSPTAITTSLNITVETDLTTLDKVTIVATATAGGRPDLTTTFIPVPKSIHWTVELPNIRSGFEVSLTATGNTSDGQTVSYTTLAMVIPGQQENILLKLDSKCVGLQAPICKSDETCDDGACVPVTLPATSADAGLDTGMTGADGGGQDGTGGTGSSDARDAAIGGGYTGTGGSTDGGPPPPDAGTGADAMPLPGSLGASCGVDQSCNSTHCVKGICCNTTCATGCYSCVVADTGGALGLCLPLQAGKSDGTCIATPEATCQQTGACDGLGACQMQPTTVECVAESCAGIFYTPPSKCDGHGTCASSPMSSCGSYLCDESQRCKTRCTVDTDCAPESFCSAGGQCVPAVCTTDDWCWHNPRPHGLFVSDIWGPASDDIWAVAAYGAIAHWDGTGWQGFKSVTSESLTAVHGAGGVVWAVGTAGTIIKWDGLAWRRVTSGVDGDLLGVWASSATDAWAVGPPAVALHWDGTSWATVALPTSATTSAVVAVSGRTSTDVWIASGGNVFHWDGQSWKADVLLTADKIGNHQEITDILAAPMGDTWVTTASPDNGAILQRTDQGWSSVAITDARETSTLAVAPSGAMWEVSSDNDSSVYSWNPLMSEVPTAVPGLNFLGLSSTLAFANDDVFFAGISGAAHWDQVSLVETFAGTRADFSGIAGSALPGEIGIDDVWVVGTAALSSNGVIYNSLANNWVQQNPPLTSRQFTDVVSISGISWVVGEGPTFMGWTGAWAALTPSSTDSGDLLTAVDGDANSAWAVGPNGRIWS